MVKWSKVGGQSMENVMSAKDRLLKQQTALVERGFKDVKFYFSDAKRPLSHIKADAADGLEAFLSGELRAMPPADDSVRQR